MNSVLNQAEALKKLISSLEPDASLKPIETAITSCCAQLIENGNPRIALELADAWFKENSRQDRQDIRLQVIYARGLNVAAEYSRAYDYIKSLMAAERELLKNCPDEMIQLRIQEGTSLRGTNRTDESIRLLLEVREQLMILPDSSTLGWCAFQLSAAELVGGERSRAKSHALEALVSARRSGDRYLEACSQISISMIDRYLCRWHNSLESAAEALRIAVEGENELLACHALRGLGIGCWKRGMIKDALGHVDEFVARVESVGQSSDWWGWSGALLRGMIVLHAGRFSDALSILESDGRWQVPDAHSRASLLTTEYLGDVHLEQGQAEPALALYDEVFPKAVALVPKGDIVAELRRRRAECYYLLGRHQDAYTEAKTGLEHCRELGDRYEEASTYRVLALSAAALGKADEAKRWFDQGFAYYDDIETPYEWGKLWMAYGDWLRGPHAAEFADPPGGLEAYHAARDHFERMGAMGKLAEAEARIASATGRPPKTAATNPTVRETPAPRRRPRGSSELERKSQWAFDTFGILTANKPLLRMLDDIAKIARTSSPILVLGESGTGKELVATAIHEISGRSGSFLPINCSSLPREVIESELFGHAQGAFTGAAREKAGLLEVCAGGTAFLDEIAEIPLELQSRLLRFLETGELRRVGATRNLRVDTRIVAATNREQSDLERGEGFRQDLYYRLAHAVMVLPPLRRRGDDIELLANHFLEAACVEQGKDVSLSVEALEALREHRWPGNVRELKAVMKRVVILAPGDHVVTVADLALKATTAPVTLLEELAHSEREKIAAVLKQSGNSRTEAAKTLGIPRTTLLNKIRRYGLE